MANETDKHACHERLAELEEENRFLRGAAARFGELAERLSEQLARERRPSADRRQTDRQASDRRVCASADKRTGRAIRD